MEGFKQDLLAHFVYFFFIFSPGKMPKQGSTPKKSMTQAGKSGAAKTEKFPDASLDFLYNPHTFGSSGNYEHSMDSDSKSYHYGGIRQHYGSNRNYAGANSRPYGRHNRRRPVFKRNYYSQRINPHMSRPYMRNYRFHQPTRHYGHRQQNIPYFNGAASKPYQGPDLSTDYSK